MIYYGTNGNWVLTHDDALFLEDEAQAKRLLAEAVKQAGFLVGAYLSDAVLEGGKPVPTHFREDFRTRGPSNYEHGKQTEV